MAFCSNCGHSLPDGVKFCGNCGSPVVSVDRTKRQQEYAGKIIKCPSCGTELPSFTAVCPCCGHEINSAQVSSAIKDFTNQIRLCDVDITNSSTKHNYGWKSWGIFKKIGWIVLNILTFFVPLLIYLVSPLIGTGKKTGLTPEEQRKAVIINNFIFPNDRESILEGLLYIKSQATALQSGKIDRNTAHWLKVWKNKAYQLFEKSEIMFKGDTIAHDAYSSILESEKSVKKRYLIRVGLTIILIILLVGFVFYRSWVGSILVLPTSGIVLQIPDTPTSRGVIEYNYDTSLSLEVRRVSEEQYLNYLEKCIDNGYTIESKTSSYPYHASYEAYNEEGYKLDLDYEHARKELQITVKAPEELGEIQWPKNDLTKRLPTPTSTLGRVSYEGSNSFSIYIGNMTKQEYNDYVDACMNMGFTVDYYRGENYFHASDKNDYRITVSYKGNKVVYIDIDAPRTKGG